MIDRYDVERWCEDLWDALGDISFALSVVGLIVAIAAVCLSAL